jgi:hypothetical protein
LYFFFDKGMCGHLVRVAIMVEASLPGMDEVKKLTVRRRREKLKSLNDDVSSDSDFEKELDNIDKNAAINVVEPDEQLNVIESVENQNQSEVPVQSEIPVPEKRRGRRPKEKAPLALSITPEKKKTNKKNKKNNTNNNVELRRSQRNKK